MKPTLLRARRGPRAALILLLGLLTTACESDSVFEGAPVVAPPTAEFDLEATATTAIHGGVLAVGVTARDEYVGVDSLVVRYSGALQGSFTRRFSGSQKQVRVDTLLPIPFGTQGEVLLEAYALNRYGSTAGVDSVIANIVRQDTIRPGVSMQSAALPQRAELSGTMSFTVTAQDDAFGGGLALIGAAIRVGDIVHVETLAIANNARSATREIVMPVSRLTMAAPSTLSVEFYAFAVDQAGNCSAAGAGATTVGCTYSNGTLTIPSLAGQTASLQITATTSLPLVRAAAIGDLVVDPVRRRLYLSNQDNNSVEAIAWSAQALTRVPGPPTLVGARPLGLTLDRTGDTLIVANSGGTNLSYVALGTLQERHRYEARNSTLYQLRDDILTHFDYADRPQFVAQDAFGVVFYSTAPTSAAPGGTIQTVEWDRNWLDRENDLMLWTQIADENGWGPSRQPTPCWDAVTEHIQPCMFAFVDSVKIDFENPMLGTQIEVHDHVPGRPDQHISWSSPSLKAIEDTLRARGSDLFMFRGVWVESDIDGWLSGDTTYVVASGDGSSVVFAESDEVPGRVWAWNALEPHPRLYERLISDVVNIEDLVNNTSAPMKALSLNTTGTLIATRSVDAAFFFNNPLRLRGTYFGADIANGIGLALHPAAQLASGSGVTNWAAAGSTNPELILIDTRNFRRVGTIPLLEPVGGPIRVTGALSGDPADVVAHIFGVTTTGTVFHVPVRAADITQ